MTNNTHMSGNSAAYGRKNAKDSILYAYAKDFIEDIEFFLLYSMIAVTAEKFIRARNSIRLIWIILMRHNV